MQIDRYTVGVLNMRRCNSVSKLTIQKVNFLILRQLTHRCILMLRPWHCCSTSCHCKLSIGRQNRSCSRNAVTVSRITVYLLSGKLYSRIPCILTDLERQVAIDVQNSHDRNPTKTHAVVCGIFNRRAFLFADCQRSNESWNNWSTTSKRLTSVWLELQVLCVDSWAPSISLTFHSHGIVSTFAVRSSHSNVASLSNLASHFANVFATNFYLCVIREK